MTSEATQGETEAFFKANQYFGLEPANIVLFEQNVIPCITNDGKVRPVALLVHTASTQHDHS